VSDGRGLDLRDDGAQRRRCLPAAGGTSAWRRPAPARRPRRNPRRGLCSRETTAGDPFAFSRATPARSPARRTTTACRRTRA
jgi:hypothetical protein